MITDYASLKAAIADFTHRADLASYLDDFIAMAEERLASDLRVRELESTATGTLSGLTLALPSDFAAFRRFTIQTTAQYTPEFIGPDGIKAKYQAAAGLPAFAAIVGANIEFNRSVDAAYAYTLDYWMKPVAITSGNTTSTVLTNYRGLYLYACLLETAFFAKNDADVARYSAKYRELVDFANSRGKASGGPLRIVRG